MAQVIKADLDEILFEERERRYGAYELRKQYPRRLMLAVIIIVSTFGLAVALPAIIAKVVGEAKKGPTYTNIELTDLPPPPPPKDEETPPPPPPPPPPKPQIKTVAFKVPEPKPAEDIKEEEPIVEIDSTKNVQVSTVTQEGTNEGYFDGEVGDGEVPDVVVEEKKEPDADAFIFVQEEPKPVNMADISKLIGYPQIAKDAGIQGDVVIRILVDEKGNYVKHKVIKQMHPILAKACEDNISKLKFTPAIQGGKPIKFWVNVPFKFKLMQ